MKIRCPFLAPPLGGRVVVNGAALALCHMSGSHIFEKSRFLKKRFRLRIVSKIDLAGSRGMRRKYFSKMPGNIPPQRALRQRGAPHLEPLFSHSLLWECQAVAPLLPLDIVRCDQCCESPHVDWPHSLLPWSHVWSLRLVAWSA